MTKKGQSADQHTCCTPLQLETRAADRICERNEKGSGTHRKTCFLVIDRKYILPIASQAADTSGCPGENLSGCERQMLARLVRAAAIDLARRATRRFSAVGRGGSAGRHRADSRQNNILLVEHEVDLVLDFADEVYVMVSGQISYSRETASLRADIATQSRLIGVGTNVLWSCCRLIRADHRVKRAPPEISRQSSKMTTIGPPRSVRCVQKTAAPTELTASYPA